MAKSKIPPPLERRHLLQRDTPPAQSLAIAEAYLEAGRTVEAVDFLKKAEATDRLEALIEEATEQGDAFLLRAVANALGTTPDAAHWNRLQAAAEAAGKGLYADTARRQSEIDDE